MLPAVPMPERGLRGVCLRVEQQVAWWICLERHRTSVQLAPSPDGDRSGGGVRQRCVTFYITQRFISAFHFCPSFWQADCMTVIAPYSFCKARV